LHATPKPKMSISANPSDRNFVFIGLSVPNRVPGL
jgi:hypothetical protein